jgi:predicted MFS family arabinose efflux permease
MGETIGAVIAGRLLQGAGAISSTLTALMADATRESLRTRAMAVLGVGIGSAFLVALIAGPAIAAAFGIVALFWLAAVLAILAALLYAAMPAGIERPTRPGRWSLRPALRLDLLRLDASVFLLHAILTASFVALPFLFTERLGLPYVDHWKIYVGALLVSLLGTVPLVIADDRQGKATTVGIAIALLLGAQLLLTFVAFGVWPVFGALALFFAGFNFLEAGLPARLSLLADGALRGASLGVFSSSQFLGAFAGGLIGGRFLAAGRPADVFFVCALLAGIWLAAAGVFRRS